MERLKARNIKQRLVATESGVPFSTVSKIAQGVIKQPSVHTIQKLYEYFIDQDDCADHRVADRRMEDCRVAERREGAV